MAQHEGTQPSAGSESAGDSSGSQTANENQVLVTDVPRRRAWTILAIIGAVYVSLAFLALRQKSVTVDEFGHLPVGYNLLTTRDFKYCELNPPLMNVLSALPLMFMDIVPIAASAMVPDEKYAFWANGYEF